jgi:hypothetical protein
MGSDDIAAFLCGDTRYWFRRYRRLELNNPSILMMYCTYTCISKIFFTFQGISHIFLIRRRATNRPRYKISTTI